MATGGSMNVKKLLPWLAGGVALYLLAQRQPQGPAQPGPNSQPSDKFGGFAVSVR